MRLAKYLAHAGVASRRKAETLVAAGRVRVGGSLVRDPALGVDDGDDVTVDGAPVRLEGHELEVYLLHKPADVVSTAADTHGRRTVVDLVASAERLYPVGRLDADATGLILLTNDGELAHALTHPSFEVPKTYRATVRNAPVREPALRALREGVALHDGVTAPARVRKVTNAEIELTLHEGRKRQVKRMCEAVGHRVKTLRRVAFAGLELGDLAPGGVRRLGPEEVARLRAIAARKGAARARAAAAPDFRAPAAVGRTRRERAPR